MANIKISELQELLTVADNDMLPVVDVSDNETKKIKIQTLNIPNVTDDFIKNSTIEELAVGIYGSQLKTLNNILIYPRPYYRIGDILESTNPNNPADDGYIGTWELYGQGRVTACIDTEDTNFDSIGKEIGESTHKLTLGEMPNHYHHLIANDNTYSADASPAYQLPSSFKGYATGSAREIFNQSCYTTNRGEDIEHNNIQKTIVVYRWRRIA